MKAIRHAKAMSFCHIEDLGLTLKNDLCPDRLFSGAVDALSDVLRGLKNSDWSSDFNKFCVLHCMLSFSAMGHAYFDRHQALCAKIFSHWSTVWDWIQYTAKDLKSMQAQTMNGLDQVYKVLCRSYEFFIVQSTDDNGTYHACGTQHALRNCGGRNETLLSPLAMP